MVAKVSLGTAAGVLGGHRSLVYVAQCSLVVSDHWQAAASSVGEIITIVQPCPHFLVPPPRFAFVACLADVGF